MALSWPKRPGALKAAIGIGKQTLAHPRQSAARRGAAARASALARPGAVARAGTAAWLRAFHLMTRRAHSGLIPSSLMIGHHFSASALRRAFSASGVWRSRG